MESKELSPCPPAPLLSDIDFLNLGKRDQESFFFSTTNEPFIY